MKKLKWLSFACALGFLFPLASCGNNEMDSSNLNNEVYRIYQLAQNSGYEGTYEEWLDSIKGEKGDNIELRVENGYIQWKATGETTWKNLVSIEDLKGKDGSAGNDGVTPTITINEEGYWVINGETSNVLAVGVNPTIEISTDGYWVLNGEKTETKALGEDGKTPEVTIGNNGNWFINGVDTGKQAEGKNGENGSKVTIGSDGYWYIDDEKTEIRASAKDGNSYYVWIKYATKLPSESSDMCDTPTEDIQYIGIYSGTLSSAPENYSDYNWFKIKGEDATFPEATVTIELTVPSLLENWANKIYDVSSLDVEEGKNYGYCTIPCSTWLDDKMPVVRSPYDEWFNGWYIKGTDKLVDKYTCIGGDITIEPHWDENLIQEDFDLSKDFTFDYSGTIVSGFIGDYTDIVLPKVSVTKSIPGITSSEVVKVTGVGSGVLDNDKITSIRVGANITSIMPFIGGSNLSSIVVDEKNRNYDSRENCNAIIYSYDNTIVAMCKTTIIPTGVDKIRISSNLESFTVPNGLKRVGIGDVIITNLYLPSSVNQVYCPYTGSVTNLYFDGTLDEWLEVNRTYATGISHIYVKNDGVWEEVNV